MGTSGGERSTNVVFCWRIWREIWNWRVGGELGDGRSGINWSWSGGELSRHDIGFGDVGWNRKTSIVVSRTCPEVAEPLRNIGGSDHVVEGASWEMIYPCKPGRGRFWRK